MLTAKLQPHYEGLDSSMMSLKMPHDISIEQTVIGALMLDKSAFKICNRVLTSKECFYRPIHQSIFDAIKKLDNKLNKSLRELADHVKVEYGVSMSHTTIGKKIAKYKENMLPELEPLKQKNDTTSKAKGNTKNQTTTTAKNTK